MMESSKANETKNFPVKKDPEQKPTTNNTVTKAPNSIRSYDKQDAMGVQFSPLIPGQPIVQTNCFYKLTQLACFWSTPDEPCFQSEIYKPTTHPNVK